MMSNAEEREYYREEEERKLEYARKQLKPLIPIFYCLGYTERAEYLQNVLTKHRFIIEDVTKEAKADLIKIEKKLKRRSRWKSLLQ